METQTNRCKISYEDTRTLLESEGKELKDYELLTIDCYYNWNSDCEGYYKIYIDGKDSKYTIYLKTKTFKQGLMEMASENDIQYISTLSRDNNGSNYKATGLRRRPKSKTKTAPPPTLTIERPENE